jgi:hypothetical protein
MQTTRTRNNLHAVTWNNLPLNIRNIYTSQRMISNLLSQSVNLSGFSIRRKLLDQSELPHMRHGPTTVSIALHVILQTTVRTRSTRRCSRGTVQIEPTLPTTHTRPPTEKLLATMSSPSASDSNLTRSSVTRRLNIVITTVLQLGRSQQFQILIRCHKVPPRNVTGS